jgi:hypothetical protein
MCKGHRVVMGDSPHSPAYICNPPAEWWGEHTGYPGTVGALQLGDNPNIYACCIGKDEESSQGISPTRISKEDCYMNIYKIARPEDDDGGWDTYIRAAVVAKSHRAATQIHPEGGNISGGGLPSPSDWEETWIPPETVVVQFVGKAAASLKEGTVICASFRNG